MRPLIELSDKDKETHFNLQISDLMNDIDQRFDQWLNSVLAVTNIPEEIETRNLISDLNYHFSKGIWLIQLGESLGYSIDLKDSFEHMYHRYTSSDEGYKALIDPIKYYLIKNYE